MTTYDCGNIDNIGRLTRLMKKGLDALNDEMTWDDNEDGKILLFLINSTCKITFTYCNDEDDDDNFEVEIEINCMDNYEEQKNLNLVSFNISKDEIEEYQRNQNDVLSRCVEKVCLKLATYKDLRCVKFCCAPKINASLYANGYRFCSRGVSSGSYCDSCNDLQSDFKEICSICYNEEQTHDLWVRLKKCNHIFHMSCVSQLKQPACPMCRASFSDKDIIIM